MLLFTLYKLTASGCGCLMFQMSATGACKMNTLGTSSPFLLFLSLNAGHDQQCNDFQLHGYNKYQHQ